MESGSKAGFFCDVEQNTDWGTVSSAIPCLVSHGKIIHGTKGLMATGLEHVVMQGSGLSFHL